MPISFILLGFSFIIGASAGSFLTALIWRTHQDRSMRERHSVCPQCQHPLGAFDLLPILSYLFLGGRCRYCQAHISPQYLITEISTALLFTASASLIWQHAVELLGSVNVILTTPSLLWWVIFSLLVSWLMVGLLIALFVYDYHWGLLPDVWTLGGSFLGSFGATVAWLWHKPMLWQPLNTLDSGSLLHTYVSTEQLLITVASGICAALFFVGIVVGSERILHKPGMGIGDVKLGLLMGLFLGFPGIVVALYLAFILGAVLSLLLIAAKHKKMGQTIPFGPFLVAGTIISLWLTPLVAQLYRSLV